MIIAEITITKVISQDGEVSVGAVFSDGLSVCDALGMLTFTQLACVPEIVDAG